MTGGLWSWRAVLKRMPGGTSTSYSTDVTHWLKNATSPSLVIFEHDRVMYIIPFFLDNKVGVCTLHGYPKKDVD